MTSERLFNCRFVGVFVLLKTLCMLLCFLSDCLIFIKDLRVRCVCFFIKLAIPYWNARSTVSHRNFPSPFEEIYDI